MDIHMATEAAYKNGYNKAAEELRGVTTMIKVGDTQYICSICKSENTRPFKFCHHCGRVVKVNKE